MFQQPFSCKKTKDDGGSGRIGGSQTASQHREDVEVVVVVTHPLFDSNSKSAMIADHVVAGNVMKNNNAINAIEETL